MSDNALKIAINEKDIENYYRPFLMKAFGDMTFTSPFNCDGYGESDKHKLRLLTEFKDDLDLNLRVNQIKILCQTLYYVKKFELSGKILPNIIFVGDRNECFVIHTNDIFSYLGMNFDWSIAPSKSHTNLELFNLMMSDTSINPFVFTSDGIIYCVEKIKEMNQGIVRFVPITPHNITEVFIHFEKKVMGTHKLTTNEMANLFTQILINPDDNYLHPITRRKTIVTKSFGDVSIKSREAFESFFSHFSKNYSPTQKEHLTAVVDRLVQDTTRRKQGEFFTPTIWVDKAHEYISSVYGEDWKEKYIVWDPAWGTGNLTRDYKFKELYVSTLNYSDIQTAEQMGYNPEAIKFQFDFLNDDYEYLPKGLRNAIESDRQIIILMNPPYATTANFGSKNKEEDGNDTTYNKIMKDNDMGRCSDSLYGQFIYRFYKLNKLKNIKLSFFSPPLLYSGSSYKNFRKEIFSIFNFVKGFIMDASNFADVKSWGLSFSILDSNGVIDEFISDYEFDLLEIVDYIVVKIGIKNVYNTDNTISASNWVRKPIKGFKTFDAPQMKSAIKINHNGIGCRGNIIEDGLGFLYNNSNNVDKNGNNVGLFTSCFTSGSGCSISKNNFDMANTLFTSRRLISKTWINSKDEYLTPNEEHEYYEQYSYDSIIYSLFNSASNQSSLRQITYKEQIWDIKNEFFWLSKRDMMELANDNNYTELYNDARTSDDRYVHKLLFGEENIYDQLSPDAKLVLDAATNLVRTTMVMRMNMADDTNHLNSWDAGYAQLKLVWKEYYPEQFKEFRELYKNLENRMRPMVYELGFLLK